VVDIEITDMQAQYLNELEIDAVKQLDNELGADRTGHRIEQAPNRVPREESGPPLS
jgi:hypothetical protein